MNLLPVSEAAELNPTLPRDLAVQHDREVHFVPMADVSEEGFVSLNETRRLGDVLKGYTYFANGDVLVAKITPCMENGKATLVSNMPHEIGFGSTEFHVLRPKPGICGRYLFYMVWNSWFRKNAENNMTGTAGQKRVPAGFFETFKIPLPSLKEQQRIAAIFDKADAIRRKRQETRQIVQELLRSAYVDLFGDPRTNIKHWEEKPLGAIASIERGKFTPRPRNDPRFYDGEYPFIQTGDISASGGILSQWKQTLNKAGTQVSRSFSARTVVIAIVGATIGETAILAREMYCPDSVIGIIPHEGLATSEFLEYSLRFYKQSFRDSAPETARANINLETLRPLRIPVPTYEMQKRFSHMFNICYEMIRKMSEPMSGTTALIDSLVHRAFRGEL